MHQQTYNQSNQQDSTWFRNYELNPNYKLIGKELFPRNVLTGHKKLNGEIADRLITKIIDHIKSAYKIAKSIGNTRFTKKKAILTYEIDGTIFKLANGRKEDRKNEQNHILTHFCLLTHCLKLISYCPLIFTEDVDKDNLKAHAAYMHNIKNMINVAIKNLLKSSITPASNEETKKYESSKNTKESIKPKDTDKIDGKSDVPTSTKDNSCEFLSLEGFTKEIYLPANISDLRIKLVKCPEINLHCEYKITISFNKKPEIITIPDDDESDTSKANKLIDTENPSSNSPTRIDETQNNSDIENPDSKSDPQYCHTGSTNNVDDEAHNVRVVKAGSDTSLKPFISANPIIPTIRKHKKTFQMYSPRVTRSNGVRRSKSLSDEIAIVISSGEESETETVKDYGTNNHVKKESVMPQNSDRVNTKEADIDSANYSRFPESQVRLLREIFTDTQELSDFPDTQEFAELEKTIEDNTCHYKIHENLTVRCNIFKCDKEMKLYSIKHQKDHLLTHGIEIEPIVTKCYCNNKVPRDDIQTHIFYHGNQNSDDIKKLGDFDQDVELDKITGRD